MDTCEELGDELCEGEEGWALLADSGSLLCYFEDWSLKPLPFPLQ